MPAKRIYRDVRPEHWDHPNAGKVQDAYDRSRQRASRMPTERGPFRDPPRERPVEIPIDRSPDPRRLPATKRELPSVKNGGLIRLPAKDVAPPDVRRPTKARGPAFRLPGVTKLGRFTPIGRAFDLLDLADEWYRNPDPLKVDPKPPNTTMELKCSSRLWPIVGFQFFSGMANEKNCGLSGQAVTLRALGSSVNLTGHAGYTFIPVSYSNAAQTRFRYEEVYWLRHNTGLGINAKPIVRFVPVNAVPGYNANAVRAAGLSSPAPAAAGSPAPGANAEPSALTNPFSGPDLSNADAPGWAYDLASGQPALPRGRTPTKGKNAEPDRKVIPRSKRLAQIIWKALDKVSEGAEKVDCVYEALPENVKKRWGKDRDDSGLNIGGNFGQYGLGGAHWKAEAIWHNFEKVDINKALNCIALNEIEDQIYGAIHAKLPDNIGSALDPAFKGLADILRDIKAATGIEVE